MIEAAVPRLAAARGLIDRFQTMIRQRNGTVLRTCLEDAAATMLASFANGLRADEPAVAAALAEPWSNGQTEGHITKLKLVKRQMYQPKRWSAPEVGPEQRQLARGDAPGSAIGIIGSTRLDGPGRVACLVGQRWFFFSMAVTRARRRSFAPPASLSRPRRATISSFFLM